MVNGWEMFGVVGVSSGRVVCRRRVKIEIPCTDI